MSVFNVVRPIVNPIVRSIVNPRGGGFAGLLNLYSGAAAAYSLRALSSGWLAGDVVEVRRSGDSVQVKVGLVGGIVTLDSKVTNVTETPDQGETLASNLGEFVAASGYANPDSLSGANDGYVSTWYDQSGNGNDAIQATTTQQPKIVSAGSLVTGGLDFDGVDDFLITSKAGTLSQPISLFQVFNSEAAVASDYQIDAGCAMLSGSDGSIYYFAGSLLNSTIDFPTSGDTIHSVVYSGASSTVFADGVLVATGNTGSNAFTRTFSIGARKSGVQASRISYKEIIIYNFDESANRAAIETNINAAYSIYA